MAKLVALSQLINSRSRALAVRGIFLRRNPLRWISMMTDGFSFYMNVLQIQKNQGIQMRSLRKKTISE